MRRLVMPVMLGAALAGCDSGGAAPAPTACSAQELAAKIERYSDSASRLWDAGGEVWDAAAAARWSKTSAEAGAEALDVGAAEASAGTDQRTLTASLCRHYDELQAIVDGVMQRQAPPPAVDAESGTR